MNSDTKLTRSFTGYVATLLFFGVGAITTLGIGWYSARAFCRVYMVRAVRAHSLFYYGVLGKVKA
jgi:hypothetical protein